MSRKNIVGFIAAFLLAMLAVGGVMAQTPTPQTPTPTPTGPERAPAAGLGGGR